MYDLWIPGNTPGWVRHITRPTESVLASQTDFWRAWHAGWAYILGWM